MTKRKAVAGLCLLGMVLGGCSGEGNDGRPVDIAQEIPTDSEIEQVNFDESDTDSDTNEYIDLDCAAQCEGIDDDLGYGTSAEHLGCSRVEADYILE